MFANDIIKENKEFLFMMSQAIGTDNFDRLWNVISEYEIRRMVEQQCLESEERNGDVN